MIMNKIISALVLLSLVILVSCEKGKFNNDDLITFPNYPTTSESYSGYLDNKSESKVPFHYVFQTTTNLDTATSAPIILWLAGGDGCSSIQALIQQVGPYRMRYPKTKLSSTPNQFAWNQLSNILYIEAPVNTGFSLTSVTRLSTNDETTASELYNSIIDFQSKYPDFVSSRFIIFAEGKASQYGTLLAEKIYSGNENTALGKAGYVNLKAITLQSPMLETDNTYTSWEHKKALEFNYYHGLYGNQIENNWQDCADPTNISPKCAYFKEQYTEAKAQINPFNVNDKCQKGASSSSEEFINDISEDSYCLTWSQINSWVNANKASFNLGSTYLDGYSWTNCDPNLINFTNISGGVYKRLEALIKEKGLITFIINGLDDSVSTYLQAEQDVGKLIEGAKLTHNYDLYNIVANKQFQGVYSKYNDVLYWYRVKGAGYFTVGDNAAAGYYILQSLAGETSNQD